MMKIKFIALVLYFYFVVQPTLCSSEKEKLKCAHTPYTKLRVGERQRPRLSKRSVVNVPKLRITPHYTNDMITSDEFEYLKKHIVEPAIEYWSNALQAKNPSTTPMLVSRTCVDDKKARMVGDDGVEHFYCLQGCELPEKCYVNVPDQYLDACREVVNGKPQVTVPAGVGLPDTDYLLIVDSAAHDPCIYAAAFAGLCQLEGELDRPTMGYVNLCPSHSAYMPGDPDGLILVKHEIAHALGFTETVAFWRDKDEQPRTKRDPATNLPALGKVNDVYTASESTMRNISRLWKSVKGDNHLVWRSIVTPNIVKAAQEHFGCPTLDGVDLENTAPTFHFEKRIMETDVMVGIGHSDYVSKITLAFFLDTGWYNVNMSMAEPFKWGKDLGCTFVQKSCYEYMEQQQAKGLSSYPWCSDVIKTGTQCVGYSNAYGSCELNNHYQELKPEYQYFSTLKDVPDDEVANYGGNIYMEYCPYVQAESHCSYDIFSSYRQKGDILEELGPDSTCVSHDPSTPWHTHSCRWESEINPKAASCRKAKCSADKGLSLYFLGKEEPCPLEGGPITIEAHSSRNGITGGVVCPPCSEVCQKCPSN